jgi:hypothetical protein
MSGELGKALNKGIRTEMPLAQLEQYIIKLLKTQSMCTLCTCRQNIPRGTPLEYFNDALTLWCSPDPGVKITNLQTNSNISLSVYNVLQPDWVNSWDQYWGLQITGRGELFSPGTPEYEKGLTIIRFEGFLSALGFPLDKKPPIKHVLRVTPSEIVLKQAGLMAQGFCRKQTWHSSEAVQPNN